MPSISAYHDMVSRIFDSGTLTNNGPLVQQLHKELTDYLGISHLSILSNGTLAIQLPLRLLDEGEVITTPFSYVATTNAILWENFTPVFADIDPQTCCINPAEIEKKITSKTKAILATHVYGIPCDVEKIKRIADKYQVPVIYDAAHAFGVMYQGRSILEWGTFSTLSFHATKLFHTIEGGAVVCNTGAQLNQLNLLRSFGHIRDEYFSIGINAKMSEMHAAMGLCVLPNVNELIAARKLRTEQYDAQLYGIDVLLPKPDASTAYNYSYYPVIFPSPEMRERVQNELFRNEITPR
ncbi:MAG TPA: DegT/DnrJ/EryC1/StrS family aminotransferase, partial [Bacteroidia bacterium]|nr:DegT/DnrJ/EryC1/StrS family aminotransferase [Bacteroidia bacterium]